MIIYIDVTCISLFVCGLCCLYFVKILLVIPIKWFYFPLVGLCFCLDILCLYINPYLGIIISLLPLIAISFFLLKKKFYLCLFLMLACKVSIQGLIKLLFKGTYYHYYLLSIGDKISIISLLLYPIFMLMVFISSLVIDRLYRLGSYKEYFILVVNNKKYKTSGYFDTGNIAMHNGIPIIFLAGRNKLIRPSFFETKALINTVNGKCEVPLKKVLVQVLGKKEYQFAYLSIQEQKNDYYGCEVLLNAALF